MAKKGKPAPKGGKKGAKGTAMKPGRKGTKKY